MKRQPAVTKEETKTKIITKNELPAQEPSIQEIFSEKPLEVKEKAASRTEQPKKVKKLKRNMFSRAALRDE